MTRYATVCEPVINPASGVQADGTRAVHHEHSYSVVDVSVDSTTVSTGPAILLGVYVNTVLSAQALPIKDGSTTVITLPASAAAGAMYTFPSIRFETSIVVDPDNAATGNVTVIYRTL